MKTKWGILLLVSGLLFFGLGCMADSVAVEGIGANVEAGGPVHNGETAADESRFAEVARFRVCPREGQYGIQVPKGVWHTVVVLEPTTILESEDGAYGK